MTNYSHHANSANSVGGHVTWLLMLQSKVVGEAYLLQCFPDSVIVLTLYYSKQEGQKMWLL